MGLQFSTSFALPVPNERNIGWINNKDHWDLALDRHGNERHDPWVIDATKVIELKNYGLGKLPFTAFSANELGADVAVLAVNLVAWMQLAVLPAGHAARVWDMKRWR